jgi:hypothetical protein
MIFLVLAPRDLRGQGWCRDTESDPFAQWGTEDDLMVVDELRRET